jgi:hypothetical protein
MSLHYEWTLSLRLRREVPAEFLDELRYHLGLSEAVPRSPTLDLGYPALAAGDPSALPGGPVISLVRQPLSVTTALWGLLVRILVKDDEMYELMRVVPPWLARWSLTQGWIGFAREELSLKPWLDFYVAGEHAYLASSGEQPVALSPDAPPFTLTQTVEDWAADGPRIRPR